ncbi:uncharacterized protein LOC8030733 isoform X1 [Ixodes scapularis]|uniref:uncharacterized protein LOC8030733 isoform X1 n=1 Tax=Ixodes scapularis TaxID=6945 RepID=UPI001C38397A|nr:uncharacterized protein LOC8030733 isoform X1 [Ixodes scapularis]
MTKGWVSFLALCLASIAVLYQVEVDKDRWIASQSITLKAKLSDAFRFVTTSDYMSKWFPFVTSVREVDGKDMGIGKKYRAIYQLPVIGEYDMLYRVVEYIPHKMLAVEIHPRTPAAVPGSPAAAALPVPAADGVSVLTQIQPAKLPEPPWFPGARLASAELAVLSTTNPLFQTTSGLARMQA